MSFDHNCDNFGCDWKSYNSKIPHNPVPSFKFPTVPSHFTPIETTTMNSASAWFNIFNTLSTKDDDTGVESTMTTTTQRATFFDTLFKGFMSNTESAITATTEQANEILSSTFADLVGATPNETLVLEEEVTANNTMLIGILEEVSNSTITEMMQNGTLPVETTQNGTDLVEAMENDGVILTTISNIATSTAENTISILRTSTETAATFVTEAINSMANSSSSKSDHEHNGQFVPHYYSMDSHSLLYVILFIIIAILLLIGVILLLIYIRYRKNSFRVLHNYYEVSPLQRNNSQPDTIQEEEKNSSNDTYVKYAC